MRTTAGTEGAGRDRMLRARAWLVAATAAAGLTVTPSARAVQAAPPEVKPTAPASAHVRFRSPLPTIARVRAKTPFCQTVADDGGGATAAALDADADIDDDVLWLDNVDLDWTELKRQNALAEVGRRFTALQDLAHAAIDETKQLHAVAAQAPTTDQKQALIAYADALGGALHRQQRIADALGRFMTFLQVQNPMGEEPRNVAMLDNGSGAFARNLDPVDRTMPSLNDIARSTAADLQSRHSAELPDELKASANVKPAFSPCGM